ncbi:MAG: hypothetical protein IJH07_10940 [Ruminococcus sp.]|nr:hypothetical protein [Ruminococcus sp.]
MDNMFIVDYLNCFHSILDIDYSDKASVQLRNKQIAKARSIAKEIDNFSKEMKVAFAGLLSCDIMDDIKLFTAHFMLEVMEYNDVYRKDALEVIKNHSTDLGEEMWLKQYFETHPDDYGLIN